MNAEIERFFEQDVAPLVDELKQLEQELGTDAEPRKGEQLDRLTAAIRQTLEACGRMEAAIGNNEELLKEVQTRFREAIRPWFDQSWFMERSHTKPRGYPGDYVLLSAIYDDVPKSGGIGGLLDLFFLDQTLAHGVRIRLAGIRRFLTQEVLRRQTDLSIINVACGPAREYAEGFSSDGHPVHLTCIDMDEQALEYVQDNVAGQPNVEIDFECACYNALRMASAKSTIAKFGKSDVIYSVGLCDYLPDDYMIRLLRGWRESLKEGGVVYVAFKDRLLYNKAVYQWLVDWHFYERTEADCRRLYEEAGYDMETLDMNRDGDGVIMNFIARLDATPAQATPVRRFEQSGSAPAVREQHTGAGKFQQVHR